MVFLTPVFISVLVFTSMPKYHRNRKKVYSARFLHRALKPENARPLIRIPTNTFP